ncbi:hypothetical protein SBA4_1590016 [Candidatus Sulfopaludibacter sp. SbA4]|nr:hypothetical protein SBA4_1590016 [Candidatus Sulfopaludibacter sp. SbA4]
MWWKTDNIRKVEIERQQTTTLPNTRFEEKIVVRTDKALWEDGLDIMACIREKARRSGAEVLVKLESHAALLPGKST